MGFYQLGEDAGEGREGAEPGSVAWRVTSKARTQPLRNGALVLWFLLVRPTQRVWPESTFAPPGESWRGSLPARALHRGLQGRWVGHHGDRQSVASPESWPAGDGFNRHDALGVTPWGAWDSVTQAPRLPSGSWDSPSGNPPTRMGKAGATTKVGTGAVAEGPSWAQPTSHPAWPRTCEWRSPSNLVPPNLCVFFVEVPSHCGANASYTHWVFIHIICGYNKRSLMSLGLWRVWGADVAAATQVRRTSSRNQRLPSADHAWGPVLSKVQILITIIILTFNTTYNSPVKFILLLSVFHSWENWHLEKLSNLPQVI